MCVIPGTADAGLLGGPMAPEAVRTPPLVVPTRNRQRITWSGSTLIVRGRVRPDGTAGWISHVRFEDAPLSPSGSVELETVPGLSVVAYGPAGGERTREEVRVPVFRPLHADRSEEDPRAFEVQLPATDGVGAVAVVDATGATLDEWAVSPNPPSIRLTAPDPGETLEDGDEVRWESSDPDGDPLGFHLMVRYDGGEWITLGQTTESSLALEGDRLRWSDDAELRVVATDGVRRTASDAVPVRIRRAPLATLVLPQGDEARVTPDAVLKIAFDTPMDRATVEGSLALEVVGGDAVPWTLSWNEDGRKAFLRPDEPLLHDREYRLRLDSDVRDTYGSQMDDDRDWRFRTTEDVDPPWIRESVPAPGAFTVDPQVTIRIELNEALDPASVTSGTVRLEQSGSEVAAQVEWSIETNSILVDPVEALEPNTLVRVTVDGVLDLAGNALAAPYQFAFTTSGRVRPFGPPSGGLR